MIRTHAANTKLNPKFGGKAIIEVPPWDSATSGLFQDIG